MKTKQLMKLLEEHSKFLPVKLRYTNGFGLKPIGEVYHEPPNTFIQEALEETVCTTVETILKCLEQIDITVPFDANVVSGDDWNYQNIDTVLEENGSLVIVLTNPTFE